MGLHLNIKQNSPWLYISFLCVCVWIRECPSASSVQFHHSPFNAPHMKLIRVSAHKGALPVVHRLHGSGSIYSEGERSYV